MAHLKSMTKQELMTLIDAAYGELQSRSDKRYDELVQAVCDAMNNLRVEFPYTQLWIEDDDAGEIDVLDRVKFFEPNNFTR